MKCFTIYILFLNLTLMPLWSQNNSVKSNNNEINRFDAYIQTTSFRFGLGAFISSKSSTQYFKVAGLLEFNWNLPVDHDKSIELVLQLIPSEPNSGFFYSNGSDILKARALLIVNGLLRLKKDIWYTSKSILDVSMGIGLSYVATSLNGPFIENKDEYEATISSLFSPEIEYLFDINPKTQFSISFSVQYSPYRFKEASGYDIAKWYYIPKISYRF